MKENLAGESEFRNWLLNEKGLSKRVVSDYVSRCKRIQKEFNVNLKLATETIPKFSNLTNKIYVFSQKNCLNSVAAHSYSGNLKLAIRKYASFIHGYNEITLKESLAGESGFRDWLLNEKGLSKRVVSDYVSHCKRIQKEFNINLKLATETMPKFSNLTNKIYVFSQKNCLNSVAAHSYSGKLKLAIRKYASFIHGYDEKSLKQYIYN